jgi:hypothetical protein
MANQLLPVENPSMTFMTFNWSCMARILVQLEGWEGDRNQDAEQRHSMDSMILVQVAQVTKTHV